MLFNSVEFAIFLPIVFLLYWLIPNGKIKSQNAIIVAASYLFYGWWDIRFLSLILFSSAVDFAIGQLLSIQDNITKRKALLWISIIVNLGLLGFFKYFNFFLDNIQSASALVGSNIQFNTLKIILPVGISFYTFQTLSYTIDIYRKRLEPTNDFIAFSAYVSFFPQLVAGPIERAPHLLPQFLEKRTFNYAKAVDGLRQILWGLFKKMVIADNCAIFANQIFENSAQHNGSTLALGALFFTFQIYGDFSGYSDIAIGVARLFGFNLMRNFAFPYFSRDIAEFWRRWHISLSSWFKDYLYIPLGGSQKSFVKVIRNTFIIFIVSGFWHGANWTFIAWGALNALYFIPLLISRKNRKYLDIVAEGKLLPSFKDLFYMSTTFTLTMISWVFFRAENIHHAFEYLSGIFSASILEVPIFPYMGRGLATLIFITLFITIEWLGREHQYGIEKLGTKWRAIYRYLFYYLIIILIIWFGNNEQQFIYFQF